MSFVRQLKLSEMSDDQLTGLLERGACDTAQVAQACQDIIDAVRTNGDRAVLDFTARFDGADLSKEGIRVPESAFEEAAKKVDPELRDALLRAIQNIRKAHEIQVPKSVEFVEVNNGLWCGDRWSPIDAVCLYVPRGRGAFSSVACMLAVPAKLAKVKRPIICTPPDSNGQVDAATLVVAAELGIKEVYRVGGAQAVAAVAFGTESIPRCDKILGPGNVYVTAARQMLAQTIDPGPPAGPSESLIVCDNTTDPNNAAWNLLIEAEHGENSCAVLVTHDQPLADAVAKIIPTLITKLTEQRRAYAEEVLSTRGGIVITENINETIDFANRFAAEHVAVMVAEPWAVVNRIKHAGEILMGDYPIISLGNYAMGVNAILPTGGWARSSSGVGVLDFMKRTSIGFATRQAFEELKQYVPTISRDEGFSAHHEAILNWKPAADRVKLGLPVPQ